MAVYTLRCVWFGMLGTKQEELECFMNNGNYVPSPNARLDETTNGDMVNELYWKMHPQLTGYKTDSKLHVI